MILDPVCGMHIDPENAPAMSTYKNHTYYFCCDNCKATFDKNPEQYIGKAGDAYQAGCERKAA